MAYRRWNHVGIRIKREGRNFRARPLHLVSHNVPIYIERGFDVTVPHELLLHGDGSPYAIKP
jgi:hypothetical protein